MSLKEQSVILYDTDTQGNTIMQFPITKVENVENALATTGGTMTGAIKKDGNVVENIGTIGSTNFCGGTSLDNGACLILRGKDQANLNGRFELSAKIDEYKSYLVGYPSGKLNWSGDGASRTIATIKVDSNGENYAQLKADSEGGNLRLQKSNGVGLEFDTCTMNGTNGCARIYFNKPNVEAWMGFKFYETGDFADGNGKNLSLRPCLDWSRVWGLTAGVQYTASVDGWLGVFVQRASNNQGYAHIFVDGAERFTLQTNNYGPDRIMFPITKGSTYRVNVEDVHGQDLRFFAMKGN